LDEVTLTPLSGDRLATYAWPTQTEHAAREAAAERFSPDSAQRNAEDMARGLARRLHERPGDQLLFAIRRGEDEVGTAWVEAVPASGTLFVVDIFVLESVRRQGIGRAAVAALDDVARRKGASSIQVVVFASDAIGMKLFLGQSYRVSQMAFETDPRQAKRWRAPLGRLRAMNASQREAFLRRHGVDPARGLHGAPDLALTGSAGRALLRLGDSADGTTATAMYLERNDRSPLGAIRLIAALLRVTQDRGDVRLSMMTTPERRDLFDTMDLAEWRVGSVVLHKAL
jgi:GNAT superfamily N-acetyltransferase